MRPALRSGVGCPRRIALGRINRFLGCLGNRRGRLRKVEVGKICVVSHPKNRYID